MGGPACSRAASRLAGVGEQEARAPLRATWLASPGAKAAWPRPPVGTATGLLPTLDLPTFHALRSLSMARHGGVGRGRAHSLCLLSAGCCPPASEARLVARPVSHGSPCWCCIMALISGATHPPVCVLVAASAPVAGARCTSGRTGPAAVMTVGRTKTSSETLAVAADCLPVHSDESTY